MASNDEEIRVAITARADEYNAAMAQVSADTEAMRAKVAEEAAAFNAAQQAKFDALMRLGTAFKSGLASNDALAEAEGALDQAMAAGAITAQEYATYVARLDAAETAMAASTTAATASLDANTAAMTINGGVARELGVLIGELARGNYTRLEGSTITLANRTGMLGKAFGFLLSPLGMLMEATVAAGVAVYEAGAHFDRFDQTVLSTGNIMGSSAGQLQHMADTVGLMTGHTFEAVDAVEKLGASGRFTADELEQASRAAVNFSTVTGTQIGKAVEVIEKLKEKPKQAIVELNDQYHVLTESQAALIEKLMATGQSAQAATVFMNAFDQAMMQRKDEEEAHASALSRDWHSISNWVQQAAEHEAEYIEVANGGGDTAEKLAVAQRKAALDTQLMTHWWNRLGSVISGIDRDQVQQDQEQVAQLQQKLALENKVAQAKADQAKKVATGIDTALGGKGGKGGATDETAFQQAQYDAQQQGHEMSLAEQRSWWQQRLAQDKQGGASEAQEAQSAMRHLVTIQKEMDRQAQEAAKSLARHRIEAAKEASRQIVENFEMEREQAAAASLQRIQIDAQMQDRIAGLYGQNSEQYRRALQDRLSDTRAYVAAVEQAEKDREQQEEASYKDGEQDAMTRVQSAFAHLQSISNQKVTLGEMTAQQQIALEQDYANREYQIELSILQRWADTFKGRPRVVEQVHRQIEELNRRHQQQLDALQEKADQKRVQEANKWLQPINQAFSQSIAGMIQGTQTFHQAWQHMLQSLLLSYIQTEIATLTQHEATEQAKSSATAAGTTERNTIQAAGAAESKAIDATTGMSQITTAAATGAAKAYQAIVGIPYVGPILAPIAAGVAFAGIEAFGGSISSAAGGWDRVPVDDAPALLHRNEMVLPAPLAERVRGMTEPGDGGGGDTHHHYHINAMDARSFRDWARRNPHEVAGAAQNARRKGY